MVFCGEVEDREAESFLGFIILWGLLQLSGLVWHCY
jgi:hypothetical protein